MTRKKRAFLKRVYIYIYIYIYIYMYISCSKKLSLKLAFKCVKQWNLAQWMIIIVLYNFQKTNTLD